MALLYFSNISAIKEFLNKAKYSHPVFSHSILYVVVINNLMKSIYISNAKGYKISYSLSAFREFVLIPQNVLVTSMVNIMIQEK